MNVLIAEDDALTRLLLQRAVEYQGHACLVAQDGLEAWQLFQAHTVDVVISDWLMPLVDGVELCRRVRKQTDMACGYASRRPQQLTPWSRSLLARLQREVSAGAMT
jgi:sigma-B regulation protein RsbU (phosphoserine phosphatase)